MLKRAPVHANPEDMHVVFEPAALAPARQDGRVRAPRRVLPACIAIIILYGQLYMAVSAHFAALLQTLFLPYCLMGAFAIHFWTRPGRAECLWTFALAALGLGTFLISGSYQFDWAHTVACGSFLGLASLAVLAVQAVRRSGAAQKATLHTLVAGSIFGYSAIFIAVLLRLTTSLHPRTYDLYLYAADLGLGVPICAWVGRFVNGSSVLLHTCSVAYEALPLVVSIMYACQRSGSRPVPVRVLPAFVGGGAAAYALYNILPATGPHYVFGAAFPANLPAAVSPHLVSVGSTARNAVPSMHLACALLLLWCCCRMPAWARAAAVAFLALTVLATLGFGEHYFVDLAAAVPYALALLGICGTSFHRNAAAIGTVLTIAWMLLLRFACGLFSYPVFSWTLVIFSTTLSCIAASRVLRRFSPAPPFCKPS